MSYVNPIWLEGQRKRGLRNDAHLWVRHDAHRFAPPGSAGANPGAARASANKSAALEDDAAPETGQEALRVDLERLRWLVKDIRIDLAIRRLRFKYGYNHDQPRDERGRWTDSDASLRVASRLGRGGGRFPTSFPDATPAQHARLAVAEARAQEALQRVRQLDPNWNPSGSYKAGIEGAIREANDRAREADTRYDQLRSGIGGNFGPPLDQSGGPSRSAGSEPTPQALIDAYRSIHNMPDLFGQATWPMDKGTVAVTKIGDTSYFGVNSRAPGYTDGDQNYAIAWRSTLSQKYRDALGSAQIGEIPYDAPFHAETTVLQRAARDNGGSLANREIKVSVDRRMCWSCETVLPLLGLELGNPTVTYTNLRDGTSRTMRDGAWLPRVRP